MSDTPRVKQDRIKNRLVESANLPNPEPELYVSTMDLVVSYRRWLRAAGRSGRTISLRVYYAERMLQKVGKPVTTITYDDLISWLSEPDWTPNTRKSAVASIRVFFSWAHEEGLCKVNPAVRLPNVRIPPGVPRPAPSHLVALAIEHATDRDALIISLAAFAGLRRQEIAALRWDSVQWDGLVIKGKGGRVRRVPILPVLQERLKHEAELRQIGRWGSGWRYQPDPASPFVFPGAHGAAHMTGDRIARIIRTAMNRQWSPHTLRHRFATKAYAVERDLLTVQRLMGHSSPETTAIYTAPPDSALMRAVQGSAVMNDAA